MSSIDWSARLAPYAEDDFLGSLLRQYERRGRLSERQEAAAEKVLAAKERFAARKAEQADADAALLAQGIKAPMGKVKVIGTVLSIKEKFSEFGMTLKMIVRHEDGWRVWVTVPAAIRDDVRVGDTVSFHASLTRSDKDALFAFGNRPSQATIVIKAQAA